MTTITTDTAREANAYRLAQARRLLRFLEEQGYVTKQGDGWTMVAAFTAGQLNDLDMSAITDADGVVIPDSEDIREAEVEQAIEATGASLIRMTDGGYGILEAGESRPRSPHPLTLDEVEEWLDARRATVGEHH